jgi:glycine cleavage system transcriptional repressor
MILITATGRDHPGMVAALASALFAADCNIEDATMTRLCGEFAMILVVTPPRALGTADLLERLQPLHVSHGLRIHCSEVESADEENFAQESPRYMLSVYGVDKTGLVAQVAYVLAAHGVNITDLQTRVAAAHTVYIMLFELELPSALNPEALCAALDAVTRELQVDYTLRALDEDAL